MAIIKENTSSLFAAAEACPALAALKQHSWDDLNNFSHALYKTEEDQRTYEFMVNSFINDRDPTPIEHKLAELLYYRQGHIVAQQGRWANLTTLQMINEILVRGICSRNQLPDTRFRMQVMLMADENAITQQKIATNLALEVERENLHYDNESDDECDSDEEEDDEKAIIIMHWVPKLGRAVAFRY